MVTWLVFILFRLLLAFVERNVSLHANEIKFGRRTIRYSDIRSFEIATSEHCENEIQVLTLFLRDSSQLSGSPIDFGVSSEINSDHLNQTLLEKIPSGKT